MHNVYLYVRMHFISQIEKDSFELLCEHSIIKGIVDYLNNKINYKLKFIHV